MNIQTALLTIQTQFKVFHWQTRSYARHEAFGTAYDELSPLVDKFVEIVLGVTDERMKVEPMELVDVMGTDPKETCLKSIETIKAIRGQYDEYPDLQNICDEMIGVIGQLKYRLTLTK